MKKTGIQDRLQESFRSFSRRIAIRRGTQTLTYEELDRKSNCVAHWLLDKKMNRHTLIGILMNDRIRFIYTMIGILKAGCVFVSLDPAYPDTRLERMIDSIGPPLILSDEVNRNRGRQREFTCIDDLFPAGESGGGTRPLELTYSGEDQVYIYFTSGTTGTPRGILGKNKSLRQFIQWEVKTFKVDETYRVSQLTTPGFDAVLRDIFVPLFAGGCICIPEDPGILTNSQRLIRWVDHCGINLIHCVPGLFRMLNVGAPALSPHHFKGLKYIVLSGERIPPRELVRWYETFAGRIQLVNFWGPTETTMIKTFYFIRQTDVGKERIPIGKPIPGARVIIMDGTMKVCKERMAGRLYIRTPHRSFGYCNDPMLTHEKFIKNPFNNDPADLLYDTGDLGRLLPDGNIEFLGREDRQVKIMGIRVELEGIENVLLKHPALDETVVIKKDAASASKPGEDSLIAYITAKENQAAKETLVEDVRTFLSGELPGYMVPAIIMQIEKIPRKPNGKVDHEALPDPFTDKDKEKDYVPPATPLQAKLAHLWSEILNIDKISINSHFFQLGGNSLNLMALNTKIHKEFDVRVPLEKMFNNPTIEMLSTIIDEMERELYFSIEPVEKKEYYALSPAQERLFFLYQVGKNSVVYNMPQILAVGGELDREKLREIFGKIIKRHDSFRTTFEMVHGNPVQRVHENEGLEFEISGLECSKAEAENMIKKFFRPFDLSQAPLLRVDYLTIESTRQILLIDMHHIITDEASQILLEKEFKGLYAGEELPRLRLQHKDYAGWQNSKKQKFLIKEQHRYWMEVFAGEVPVLNLPTDYPRPPRQSFEGNRVGFVLTGEESRILTQLAKETGVTLYMCVLSVFNILLARLSQQEDIVVGTPAAARRHADLENIIGMFVNTLPIRNNPRGEMKYTEFLEELKKNTLKAYENQEYPFDELVENISVRRDPARNPVFDVIFNLVNIEEYTYNIPGIEQAEQSQYQHRECTSKFDLTLTAIELEKRLLFTIEYYTRLFKSETIDRFIIYFKKLINSIGEDFDKKLSELEMITEGEKHRILYDFNDTQASYPQDTTIHRLFEKQVEKTPDYIALVGPSAEGSGEFPLQVSYSELNAKANGLAIRLHENGVRPDIIVGIMLERSIELIFGILGILKAGGAYLPIDPEYPQERIDYMLNDSNAKMLVEKNTIAEGGKLSGWKDGENINKNSLSAFCQQSMAAYIIFTSGTTGRPKGTLIDHRNVVRLIFNEKFSSDFSSSDIWTMFHSPCFDFSVWEMYGALLYGGKLIIVLLMVSKDSSSFLSLLEKESVSVLNQTPSAFYNLSYINLSPGGIRRQLNIKYIIFGGEALNPGKLGAWRESYPETIFINMFGITETTVHVTYKEITPTDITVSKSNIGKPIPTLWVYIFDRHLKPVPVGVLGEIYVGGLGVARGYLNRPGLTAEKFKRTVISHSSLVIRSSKKLSQSTNDQCPMTNDRLYKTGDLARWLADGNIEFLGRIDHQVKIRGYRVEPGEIEARLLKYGEIKQAVVLSKDTHLYAYIEAGKKLNATQLRNHLAEELPGYMIPSYFVQVEKIPLTTNGKVDAKTLERLGKRLQTGTPYAAPQNEIERQISDTWKRILHRDTVGIHDNYFDLGGTSLDIISICAQLKESFQMDFPVVDMFTYPTVHLFAEYIVNRQQEKAEEIVDRSAVFEKSKMDRRVQFQRRKGAGEIENK